MGECSRRHASCPRSSTSSNASPLLPRSGRRESHAWHITLSQPAGPVDAPPRDRENDPHDPPTGHLTHSPPPTTVGRKRDRRRFRAKSPVQVSPEWGTEGGVGGGGVVEWGTGGVGGGGASWKPRSGRTSVPRTCVRRTTVRRARDAGNGLQASADRRTPVRFTRATFAPRNDRQGQARCSDRTDRPKQRAPYNMGNARGVSATRPPAGTRRDTYGATPLTVSASGVHTRPRHTCAMSENNRHEWRIDNENALHDLEC